MSIPIDYTERVYAGVLGKIIGVYLGRPFEQWPHQRIMAELGEIHYYVHERLNVPLVVADDDISGTFTFVRALEDHGYRPDLTAAQIGQTWLNYIIENKTILWWGGMGTSTEHTAFLRMKQGVTPPRSGSIELNGRIVAEEIGAQIFIDGWAMVAPGDPELAAKLTRRAASVSHDGEAIYGAQVIAAMEAAAFVERDLNKLLDIAVGFIPRESAIYRLIADLRDLRAGQSDWYKGLARIHEKYSYEQVGGLCPMISNHAVIMLGLLWGDDNFQRSLMIANTAGYDTDCNSGNVGCLMGIKNGLAGIDAGPDWRGPVADRLLPPTADGGRCISDAVTETFHLVNAGRALAGESPLTPKQGARFHFELPGSVQGFISETGALSVENVAGHSQQGTRSLALKYKRLTPDQTGRAATATFISAEQARGAGYALAASPTLYPGQTVTATVAADQNNDGPVMCRLFLRHYDGKDHLARIEGSGAILAPGQRSQLTWLIPMTDGQPVAEIGVELTSDDTIDGIIYLDSLTWTRTPDVILRKPDAGGSMWQKAWVDGMQQRMGEWWIQNEGRGLLIQGSRDWTNYSVSTDITPHMAKAIGLAARVQGMRRYYALLLRDRQTLQLVKMLDAETILVSHPFQWEFGRSYSMRLEVQGDHIRASVDDTLRFEWIDRDRPLIGGGIGLICEEGRGKNGAVTVKPV